MMINLFFLIIRLHGKNKKLCKIMSIDHKGHDVSKQQYDYYPKMMKIDNEEEIYNMLATGSAPILVKQFYEN